MPAPLTANEYRLLVEHSPVLIWRAGVDAKCDYFNERWLAFTGRCLEDETGDGWTEGVYPEDLGPSVSTYLDHFRRQAPFEMEYRLRRHDGVYRWIFDRGVPFKNEDGTFGGFIGSCVDVDERRRAQAARERRDAEQLAYARDFEQWILAIVSHDIRTPLAAIDNAAWLLTKKAGDPASVRHLAEQVGRSSRRIADMVVELLDLSRERHGGGIPIAPAPANLWEIVRQVADELATSSGRPVRVDGDRTASGMWDAQRVAQAISNLLGNALQHSPAGSPVSARVRVEAGRAVLDVHNEGAIPTDTLPTIFEAFGARSGRRAGSRGLGLGLFIARAIARAHGGALEVDSSPERGTTFRLVLPCSLSRAPVQRSGYAG
jgi:PAS domain S-box-containing protein